MITSGELKPGSRLPPEADLAARFQVSRSPLREAVRGLCMMGVLETRQGNGTYVTALDASLLVAPLEFMIELQVPEHRHHLHAVRRILEGEAAALASLAVDERWVQDTRALLDVAVEAKSQEDIEALMDVDIEFHHRIARASGNKALEAFIDALANRTLRTRLWLAVNHDGSVGAAHAEHLEILAAIGNHNPDRARVLMSHHLYTAEDSIRRDPSVGSPAHGRVSP